MTITIGELIVPLLIICGIAALVLLFIGLMRLNQILKKVREILTRNEKNIDEALDYIPKVLHNTNEITEGINNEMKNIKGVVKDVGDTIGYAAATAQVVNEDIVIPIKEVLEILGLLKGIFVKDKKKRWLSK